MIDPNEIDWSINCFPEEQGPEGSFATGNDDDDKRLCEAIRADYANGNDWAWCVVQVTGVYRNVLTSSAYLGGCSYSDKQAFLTDIYYADMQSEVIADLNSAMRVLK